MTLTEIHQRLAKELPDRYVTFSAAVTNRPDRPISIQLYDTESGFFPCDNLEDGIAQLKLKLGLVQPEMEIEI